jgi:hypothetical protein
MNTNLSNIRFNSLARSCNDDYCPLMEELCVKMSKLSLQADTKMEAYDAKLELFFYEEKVDVEDLSRDEKNQETFVDNDETDYSLETYAFNTYYGTCFNTEKLAIFKEYAEHNWLKVDDALEYMQGCHNCDRPLDTFGNEYCNKRCCESVEVYCHPCFRGNDCLICHGYPDEPIQTTCFWGPNCVECNAYEGPEEERYPLSCVHCEKNMTLHEGYVVDDELHCNLCAVDVFDKTEHLDDQDNDDQDNDDQDNDDQDSNDYRKRDRESDDDDESESKRQRVNEKKTRDMMSKLTYESFDIWDLALDINNGDKEAALDMIEDRERLRNHPRVIEYYRAKNEDMDFEECSSEYSEESSQDDDLQKRKRARVSDDDAFELDISDVESHENFVIDLLDDEDAPNAMVIDLVSDDEDEDEDEDEDDDTNSYEDECYDYAESVVDDDGVVEMEEDEVPNQHLYNAMLQMEEENASLRHELHVMRTQRHMLFPEGSSISITIEGGQRYINIHDAIPHANNSPMTLDELDRDEDESSCGEEVSCGEVSCDEEEEEEEEEDNMDYLDMDESV